MSFIKKNYKKLIGYAITIVAIIFVVQMLMSFDIDYSVLWNFKSIAVIAIFSLLYGFIVFAAGYPWKKLIQVFTGENIPFYEVSEVWSKSNVLKYIPGNIFQYVGRNQIAIKFKLDHILIASCTLLEVLFNLIGTFCIGAILYFPGLQVYWEEYFKDFILNNAYIIAILIIVVLAVIFAIYKLGHKYKKTIKSIFEIKNFKVYFMGIIYFAIISTINSLSYIAILTFVLEVNVSIDKMLIIMGAFMLSWIVGFITPGAPGGIGVRELAMSLILEPIFNIEAIMLAIVIYRIMNIFGDFIGVLYSTVYKKIKVG